MALRVLCLCTGNSARSIIAEALFAQAGVDVISAGTAPKGVNPLTIAALAEIGIDASRFRSKHVDEVAGERFTHVITLCDDAAEQCPVFPGDVERLHWSTPDPAAVDGSHDEKLAAFRATVAALERRVTAWLAQIQWHTPVDEAPE
jgi:arsenate reductase